MKGAELERNNNYYEAIRYYRKALQLVPDIDVQVFKKTKQKEFKYNSENKGNPVFVIQYHLSRLLHSLN